MPENNRERCSTLAEFAKAKGIKPNILATYMNITPPSVQPAVVKCYKLTDLDDWYCEHVEPYCQKRK